MVVFGLVKDLASRESVVNWSMTHTVGQMFSVWFSATKEPVQPYNFICSHFEVQPLAHLPTPTSHPFVSTSDIYYQQLRFSILFNKLMHTVCKFHTCACFPWPAKISKTVYLETSNVRFGSVF